MPRTSKTGGAGKPPVRSEQDIQTDKLFLTGDDQWGQWPVLPVKHKTEKDSKGNALLRLLLAEDRQVVYLTNLYVRDFDNCETRQYTDREAMILHGWVVD